MSLIASFYVLDRSALPGFMQAAGTPATLKHSPGYDYLREHTRQLDVQESRFAWSGSVMLFLLLFLEDSGMPLGKAAFEEEIKAINDTFGLTYVITSADKEYLPALDSANVDHAAVARFFGRMAYTFDRLPHAVDDGLNLLYRSIAALADEELFVITIG